MNTAASTGPGFSILVNEWFLTFEPHAADHGISAALIHQSLVHLRGRLILLLEYAKTLPVETQRTWVGFLESPNVTHEVHEYYKSFMNDHRVVASSSAAKRVKTNPIEVPEFPRDLLGKGMDCQMYTGNFKNLGTGSYLWRSTERKIVRGFDDTQVFEPYPFQSFVTVIFGRDQNWENYFINVPTTPVNVSTLSALIHTLSDFIRMSSYVIEYPLLREVKGLDFDVWPKLSKELELVLVLRILKKAKIPEEMYQQHMLPLLMQASDEKGKSKIR